MVWCRTSVIIFFFFFFEPWYSHFLTSASLQPSFGRVYKNFQCLPFFYFSNLFLFYFIVIIFKIKGTFLTALCIFEIGSLTCGLASSGIGMGGLYSGALVIIAHTSLYHSLPLRAYRLPLISTSSETALHLWANGCHVLDCFGGRSPIRRRIYTSRGAGVFTSSEYFFFFPNIDTLTHFSIPVGAFSVVVTAFCLKLPPKPNQKRLTIAERLSDLDLIGALILIPAVVCVVLALQWGGSTYSWNNPRIIGLFVSFGCLMILFIYSQIKQGERATLPIRILSQRTVAAASCFSALSGGTFFVLIFYLPLYFQQSSKIELSTLQRNFYQTLNQDFFQQQGQHS